MTIGKDKLNALLKEANWDGLVSRDKECGCLVDFLSPLNCLKRTCSPAKLGNCRRCGGEFLFPVSRPDLCQDCWEEEEIINAVFEQNCHTDESDPAKENPMRLRSRGVKRQRTASVEG